MYETSAQILDRKIEICRLCLSYTKIYVYLNKNEKLCHMLKSFTSIEILPLDQNSIVCYKCRLNLNLAYYIQQNMLKAEEKFQQQIPSTMIKEEPDFEFSEQELNSTENYSGNTFPEMEELKQTCHNDSTATEDNLYQSPVTEEVEDLSQQNSSEAYCKICNRYYSCRKSLLAHHRKLHLSIKCPECNLNMKAGRVQTHMKRFHPGCEVPKYIPEPKNMKKLPELYCKSCNKYYSSRKALIAHRRKLHLSVKCPECDINIPTGRIQTHMKRYHPNCQVPNNEIHHKENTELSETDVKFSEQDLVDLSETEMKFSEAECSKLSATDVEFSEQELNNSDQLEEKYSGRFPELEQTCSTEDDSYRTEEIEDRLSKLKSRDTYCKICDKYYSCHSALVAHRKKMHLSVKCTECNINLNAGRIQTHMKRSHPGCEFPTYISKPKQKKTSPELYCKICDRYFVNNTNLMRHERLIHTRIIKCEVCSLEMMIGKIQQHMEEIHPGKEISKELKPKYQCEICSKTFDRKTALVFHIDSHSEKVRCPECSRTLHSFNLRKHMEQFHGEGKPETRKYGNTNANGTFTCKLCDKVFNNKRLLKHHFFCHERSVCPICGKNITKVNLQKHIETHSTTGQQICELCGTTLKNKGCLRVHMRNAHREARHKCNYCNKCFKEKRRRIHHENKVHLSQANFVCHICGKKFYARIYLKKHIDMKHLKLRPFNCEVCKNSYSSQFALITHMRIHTNETPYKCDCCGEGFRQKVSLKAHLKSKHNIEEELTVFCKVCGKGFASEVALYTHKRVHE